MGQQILVGDRQGLGQSDDRSVFGLVGGRLIQVDAVFAKDAALAVADFICGANQDGKHLSGVNWVRDLTEASAVDIRNVQEGDPSPDGKGALAINGQGGKMGKISPGPFGPDYFGLMAYMS